MFDRRQNQRKYALFMEAYILFSIHNLLVLHNAVGWEIEQPNIAEYLQIGERTVQRITKRLVKMGRLQRTAGKGQSSYIYSIPPRAVEEMLFDVFTKSNLYVVQTPNGCIGLVKDFETFSDIAGLNAQTEN